VESIPNTKERFGGIVAILRKAIYHEIEEAIWLH